MKIQEVIDRVANDPYSEGVTHGGLHPSSMTNIVNKLFWANDNNFKKVTLEISKELDDYHISVRVIKRD